MLEKIQKEIIEDIHNMTDKEIIEEMESEGCELIENTTTHEEDLEFQAKILTMRDKYENNPLAWIKDYHPEIKLFPWQEALLKLMYAKNKIITYCNSYRNGKDIVMKMQIEHWKAMGYDFNLWTKNGIEVYEKGVLVRIIGKEK